MRTTRLVILFVLATATATAAHVTVWPRDSRPGASEKYLVRVPTEGKVATTEVELEVPANVTITMLAAPAGWTHEVKRDGDRMTNGWRRSRS